MEEDKQRSKKFNFLLSLFEHQSFPGTSMLNGLRKDVGPAWFQELSETQMFAANLIFNAVSDGFEQVQNKKCRQLLTSLGLEPLPSKADLVKAIKISRGSDLAFLWFLYDSVYNLCDDLSPAKVYSQNERLLLSCICHLDMETTLRELDRILPKPKPVRKPKCVARHQKPKLCYELPYDEPVPKPKLQPLRCYQPPRKIQPKFAIYMKYKDPSYVIKNETNRWFAQEKLLPSESKNIARGILCGEIGKVIDQNFDREKVFSSLCEKHRIESEKFHKIMTKMLFDQDNSDSEALSDEYLKDFDRFERGVIYGLQLEISKTEKEFLSVAERHQKQIMMRTLVKQIVEDAADRKFVRYCKNCEDYVGGRKSETEKAKDDERQPTILEKGIPENNAKFFRSSTPNSPFTFDYEQIFATSHLEDYGIVKNSINSVLDLEKHLTQDRAIADCIHSMWRLELERWNKKVRAEEEKRRAMPSCKEIGKNKRKIFDVLKKGIAWISEEPRFVLASLPEAHCLPILREWAFQRFGVLQTDEDNKKQWKIDKLNRGMLEDMNLFPTIKVPTFHAIGIKKNSISCDEACCKSKLVSSSVISPFAIEMYCFSLSVTSGLRSSTKR